MPQAPTHPSRPADDGDDDDDVDLADEVVERRTAPTMQAAGQGGFTRGARFTRSGHADGHPEVSKGQQVRLLPGRPVPGTRYRLVRWLGEGGMGVVYEGEHEDIERRIALKILRHEASQDPVLSARFREEARAASKIGSPNIVQIFDFGELPDGRLMFVMEMLVGHGLDTEIESAPMEQGRLLAILRQVCKGLAAAHDAGIVHRDIKPDNVILISEGGRADIVKIVDFGIATMLTAGTSDAPAAGTPQYMAPEQILGNAVDGRLDVYSLGCMAYELLVGKPPFHEGAVEEILAMQLEAAPRPLGQILPETAIHPALAAVIMRCLAKHPNARYADMRDLEAALCEAQIAAGLHTAWDDLPLPDVDPERRASLVARMPRPEDLSERPRRWLWPAVALLSTAAAIVLAIFLTTAKTPEPGEAAIVDELTRAASEAGARANWVYGPPDDPRNTAYIRVLELERLEGSAADLGRTRAHELRVGFFDTLRGRGDYYWEREGGQPFAAEFYAAAWLFAHDAEGAAVLDDKAAVQLALERSSQTRTLLGQLLHHAAAGTFSRDELATAEQTIGVLAETDDDKRSAKIQELTKRDRDNKSERTLSAFELRRMARLAKASGIVDDEPKPIPTAIDPSIGDDTGAEVATTAGERPSGSGGDNPEVRRPTQRDPKESRRLSSEAQKALQGGKRKDAENLFHQALAADNRNGAALIGLSDIYFDRSEYPTAVNYAEKAVQASPKNAGYRIRLGDAYFKLLRYADARGEYEVAKQLGNKEADERLAKVKARLGK